MLDAGFRRHDEIMTVVTILNKLPHRSDQTVRIVASGAGGGNDVGARLIADGLAESLKRPVVVDNRARAGEYAAAKLVAKSRPDGRTLLLYGSGLWLAAAMRGKLPYDAVRDFSPITLAARSPNVLVVHKSVAANSVAELIVLGKARPAQIKCGYSVPGGSPHLAAQLFKVMAGLDISNVPYDSVAALFDDLLSGKIQMMFPNAPAARLHLKSTSLKALAVTSAVPSEQFPSLPTVEATLPGYVSEAVFAILAPAKTPASTVRRLHLAIARLLRKPEVKQQILATGLEVVASTPRQLAAAIKRDIHRMAKVFGDIRNR